MKFVLIDLSNTFWRARHVASRQSDPWEKVGMAMHLALASTNKIVNKVGADHCIFALEGRSWRKDVYARYKLNRVQKNNEMTEDEVEENKMFWDAYNDLTEFLKSETNCSVLRSPIGEADDIIARFIHLHPTDVIVINSTDSDYDQLICDRVSRYDGVKDEFIQYDGIFDSRGRRVKDKKTGEHKTIGDTEFVLFEKCIRGDTSDNVFSAYPGARLKGTKNRVGIIDAFNDRNNMGYNWNNFMLQRWVDHDGVERQVLKEYQTNLQLIGLNHQPDEVKIRIDNDIRASLSEKQPVTMVGPRFLKFCGRYELQKLSDQSSDYSRWLNNGYKGHLQV